MSVLNESASSGAQKTPPKKDRRSKFKYNLFCRLTFSWVDPLFFIAFKRSLNHADLYVHPSEGDSEYLLNRFNRYWSYELERRKQGQSPRLLIVFLKCFWWRLILHGFLQALEIAIFIALAEVVGYLSDYFVIESPTQDDTRNAYFYAMTISLLSIILIPEHAMAYYYSHFLGMLSRVLFSSVIYQKILRLSHTTISNLTVGHIVNLASNDIHRFDQAFLFYQFMWISPAHLIVFTYLVYIEVQWIAFVATALVLLQVPSQILLVRLFTKLKLRAALETDKRIKVMNEVISGIRVIKMYAWEYAFWDLVASIRKSEVWIIMKASMIRAINLSYFTISLPIIMFVIFSIYVNTGGTLTPRRVLTTFSLVTFIRLTAIFEFVVGTLQLSEARVAWKRIVNLLLLDELSTIKHSIVDSITQNKDLSDNSSNGKPGITNSHNISLEVQASSGDVIVNDVTASWSMDTDKPTLQNISFTLDKKNPLMAVVGPVGAGKSTLLQCLLKELPCLNGRIEVNGSIGYASQEPWIFSASMRENILFGLHYQSVWYDNVIEACALDKDISLLPHGDLTLIGERGVTLSGGQKARVSLARAVYRKADIYLLDDPLSAVDAAVSRHIFDRCIRNLLSDKCVVLVTHQLQYLQQCDLVLGLKEGCVTVYGDPSEVLTGGDILDIIGETEQEGDKDNTMFAVRKYSMDMNQSGIEQEQMFQHSLNEIKEIGEFEEEEIDPVLLFPPLVDGISYHSVNTYDQKNIKDENEKENSVSLLSTTPAEERAHGNISLKTYYNFFRAGGNVVFVFFVFFVFLFTEFNIVVVDWWISDWADCDAAVNLSRSTCSLDDDQRIGLYAVLVVAVIITGIARFILFFILVIRASQVLHDKMFKSMLRAPVLFFDTNPIGRVLNRFSKDIGFLDDLLPYITCEYLFLLTRTLAIILVAVVANPYILIALVPLLVGFVILRWYYLKTARDIKRLEALARSPLYSHISLTLQGLSTIRSYSMENEAMKQFHNYHNQHTQAWYLYIVTVRWFGMRIDVISVIFISVVVFSVIPLAASLNAGVVGLALAYAISLNGDFQYCVRQSAEVENLMVSAERVMAYVKLESEASLETDPPSSKPSSDWPSEGHLEINDLSYRHSPEGPLVLKGITCTVNSGEKIGIVGRTGAGKSSLVESLFRLAEPHGSIKIDGVEVCNIGLHDLRSKLSIIPQDPVLFGGSIRYNLDPFGYYNDDKIWKALEHVQLKSVVQALEGQLEAEVSEGGGNFSVGQKQLFCLARALLKNNKILIMDEATANVDLVTDSIIQEVIRDQFSHCTVLTIAHRLDTVMDSDKIMVFRSGELCEYDKPHVLLTQHNSYLGKLVEHTGAIAAQRLKAMASSAYNERKGIHLSPSISDKSV